MKKFILFLLLFTILSCNTSIDGTYTGKDTVPGRPEVENITIVISNGRYTYKRDGMVKPDTGYIKDNKWLYDDCGVCIGHVEGKTLKCSFGYTLTKQ